MLCTTHGGACSTPCMDAHAPHHAWRHVSPHHAWRHVPPHHAWRRMLRIMHKGACSASCTEACVSAPCMEAHALQHAWRHMLCTMHGGERSPPCGPARATHHALYYAWRHMLRSVTVHTTTCRMSTHTLAVSSLRRQQAGPAEARRRHPHRTAMWPRAHASNSSFLRARSARASRLAAAPFCLSSRCSAARRCARRSFELRRSPSSPPSSPSPPPLLPRVRRTTESTSKSADR